MAEKKTVLILVLQNIYKGSESVVKNATFQTRDSLSNSLSKSMSYCKEEKLLPLTVKNTAIFLSPSTFISVTVGNIEIEFF